MLVWKKAVLKILVEVVSTTFSRQLLLFEAIFVLHLFPAPDF